VPTAVYGIAMWSVLGVLGMVAIEVSYLPQIARLHHRKCALDISLYFPALNVAGRLLAVSYAAAIGEPVFGIGFVVGLVTRSTFLGQVIVYRRRARLGASPAAHRVTFVEPRPVPGAEVSR